MIRLIQFLLFGHIHKWDTIEECKLSNSEGSTCKRVYLKCKDCGIWKKQDLIS